MPECDHGLKFDLEEAKKLLEGWSPSSPEEYIMGNPASAEVRRRWPRLDGPCPLGCGYNGIAYVSVNHYHMGDW